MDAVELPLPAAVTVSKLMGSEGFGGVGVTSEELEARESERLSILVSSSIDTCGSRIGKRDEAGNASEPTFWNKMSNVELGRVSQLPSFHGEDSSKVLNAESTSNPLLLVPMPDAKQSIKKSGKVARSNSGSSKRSRVAQSEVSINETGTGDTNTKSKDLGSCNPKYNIAEKTQLAKQKNNSNGKRGDKRNGKVLRSKSDSFSLKAGLVSFSSAAGGNNILGLYGLKPDVNDVTKHLDEPLLNELLDGSYKCPSTAKDQGKKTANLTENIMHSVREACSILRLRTPVQPQDFAGIDNNYDRKVSTYHVSSDSSVAASRIDGDKGDTYGADLYSRNKVQDSCSKLKTTANILDFTLYRPKDILERLALPTPKDLEFLLMDAKPAAASKNNPDLRLGKPASHRGGLQPFPWSQSSGGHCKSISDSVKLSTSRNTCQGRWVKIGNPASFLEPTPGFLSELESLTYDHCLVPSGAQKFGPSENETGPSSSVNPHSSATCSIASQFPQAEHCTKLLAAAQTLYDIATHPLKQNPHDLRRWPKKPSQKAMRACNSKSNEKPEEVFAVPKPKPKPDSLVNSAYETIPSKKLKLSVTEKPNGHIQTHDTVLKGPINWSTARSSRSSPSKLLRDSVTETRHHNASTVKKSSMMPPPARVLDKASNNQPKVRKLVPMEWNRAGGKLD